ncbi:RDD family protein [Luedemannella helvata]|uniref:RDD domain-containing protein n=1 Tax=Luedemannella helvata TaxID=349315 RepID=A0ABP4W7R1_9ACTN
MSYPPPSVQPPQYYTMPTPPYANWFVRAGGFLIDWVVVAIPSACGSCIGRATSDENGNYTGLGGLIGVVFGLIALGLLIYNRWYLGGTTGQTWGRRVMSTRLVAINGGQPIGMLKAFLRDVAHIVDSIICYIGWLFPLWDAKRQTLADKIMKTVVLKV